MYFAIPLAIILFSTSALAIELTHSMAAGSGCAANQNLNASLSADSIQWNLAGFDADVATSGSRLDRKNCSVSLTIKLPSGIKISPASITYQLSTAIPPTAHGSLKVRSHYRGRKGDEVATIEFEGPSQENGQGELALPTNWSSCGGEVSLTINTSINVKRGKEKGNAKMSLKDFGNLKVKSESC